MGHWSQYDGDAYRLPHGFTRIAYDANTRRYRYRDSEGIIYQGAPGADYGILTPVSSQHPNDIAAARFSPGISFTTHSRSQTTPTRSHTTSAKAPATFHDILPDSLITSPTPTSPLRPNFSSPIQNEPEPMPRFVRAVRRAALPKMQGVVHNLIRSVITARKEDSGRPPISEDSERLLRRGSRASSTRTTNATVGRSQSMATTRSNVSRMSVNTSRRRQ